MSGGFVELNAIGYLPMDRGTAKWHGPLWLRYPFSYSIALLVAVPLLAARAQKTNVCTGTPPAEHAPTAGGVFSSPLTRIFEKTHSDQSASQYGNTRGKTKLGKASRHRERQTT
jgi:hypothetical protein